jgi:hypothetical protein
MSKDRYIYPAVFHHANDGISVEFPKLPGCLTCGDTTDRLTAIGLFAQHQNYTTSWLFFIHVTPRTYINYTNQKYAIINAIYHPILSNAKPIFA